MNPPVLEVAPGVFASWLPKGNWPHLAKSMVVSPINLARFGLNVPPQTIRDLWRNEYIECHSYGSRLHVDLPSLRAHLTTIQNSRGVYWANRKDAWQY